MFIIVLLYMLGFLCNAVLLSEPAKLLINPVTEDDHEEFELSNIISLSEAVVTEDIDKYTDEDRKLIVEFHNIYRSNQTYPIPKAADMCMMEYNKTLEWAASEYLKNCEFKHGRAKNDNMSRVTSQNLYVGPHGLISHYLYTFYIEYLDYNFVGFKCKETPPGMPFPGIRCGHFELLMWGRVKLVGCARRSTCRPRGISNDVLVGCHYYPVGLWNPKEDIYIYTYGKSCTRCTGKDGNLCHKNLCVDKRMIKKYHLDYTCELNCQNCGEPDWKNCRCKCKNGWDYPDCSSPCYDLRIDDPSNGAKPPSRMCPYETGEIRNIRCEGDENYYLWYKCRNTCGHCERISEKDNPKGLCCGGKMCERYNVLDVNTCQCKRFCPTFGCLYSGSDSSKLYSLLRFFSLAFIFFIN